MSFVPFLLTFDVLMVAFSPLSDLDWESDLVRCSWLHSSMTVVRRDIIGLGDGGGVTNNREETRLREGRVLGK